MLVYGRGRWVSLFFRLGSLCPFPTISERSRRDPTGDQLGYWETTHLPVPKPTLTLTSQLRAKCWLRGGVGGHFSINLN